MEILTDRHLRKQLLELPEDAKDAVRLIESELSQRLKKVLEDRDRVKDMLDVERKQSQSLLRQVAEVEREKLSLEKSRTKTISLFESIEARLGNWAFVSAFLVSVVIINTLIYFVAKIGPFSMELVPLLIISNATFLVFFDEYARKSNSISKGTLHRRLSKVLGRIAKAGAVIGLFWLAYDAYVKIFGKG